MKLNQLSLSTFDRVEVELPERGALRVTLESGRRFDIDERNGLLEIASDAQLTLRPTAGNRVEIGVEL